MGMSEYFFCYDINLHKHLESKGFTPITKAKAIATGRIFTLYKRSDIFNNAIDDYKKITHEFYNGFDDG